MQKFDIFEHHLWQPFARMGFTHTFWTFNSDTIIYTWLVLIVLIILAYVGRWAIKHPYMIVGHLTESVVRAFMRLITQALESFNYRYCAFIGSLFIFIFFCNVLIVIPFMEEPTKDINTTFALALVSFFYVQKESIKAHGLFGYIKEFFEPFFVLFPLEILGKLATIISLSFRLFGNIFGGSIINSMWTNAISGSIIGQLAGALLGVNIIIMLFFGIFEGFVQAFVFSVLSLTYLSMAVSREEQHE